MKVAIIHNLGRGGAGRRLQEQARRLDAEVVEVCFASSTPVTETPIVVPLTRLAPRVPAALRPPLRYSDLVALRRGWARLARLVAELRADVVYANPCQLLQAPLGLLHDGLPPAVYFCDEPRRVDYEPEAAASRAGRTKALYAPLYARERRLDRAAVARARHVLTNSQYTAGTIHRAYGRAAEPVTMGVPDALTVARAPRDPRHLLSVGALIAHKGHDLVLRAAAELGGPWPVLIVAPRPEPVEERRLRGIAAELGVRVELRVGITDQELQEVYREAYATLYLARAEPLGLVSIEAQAAGCPVIVSGQGGLPETVERDVSGFVVDRSPSAAAAALRALGEPGRRASMSAAAHEHGRRWSWDASAAQVDAALKAVIA